jgi:hypothetical protein
MRLAGAIAAALVLVAGVVPVAGAWDIMPTMPTPRKPAEVSKEHREKQEKQRNDAATVAKTLAERDALINKRLSQAQNDAAPIQRGPRGIEHSAVGLPKHYEATKYPGRIGKRPQKQEISGQNAGQEGR